MRIIVRKCRIDGVTEEVSISLPPETKRELRNAAMRWTVFGLSAVYLVKKVVR